MKKWLFISTLFLNSLAAAETIMIKSPRTSSLGYEAFIRQKPQTISYVEYQHRKLQNQPLQEEKIFSLADSFATAPELTVMHLKGLQSEAPMTLLSLRFVRDLSEKSLATSAGSQRRELQNLYCRAGVLVNEGPLSVNCPTQYISLENIRKKFPQGEKVLIETLGFSLNDPANPVIAAQMRYHWTILSNSGQAVSFYGTYEQLFQQSFQLADLVAGTCEGFTTNFDDLSLQSTAQIYFSEGCQKSAGSPAEEKRWYQEKRTWWIAAGAVILGGVIYSLKGKEVSVSAPSLNF